MCCCCDAYACPDVKGFEDINCDGYFRMAVLGDSIGRGSRGNLRAAGSFVKRIGKVFRFAAIKNLSIPGLDTPHAIHDLLKEFPANQYKVKRSLLNKADFVLIELGINDFFATDDVESTINNLATIVTMVRVYVRNHSTSAPVIALSLITPVSPITEKRAEQQSFVKALNKAMLDARSDTFPAYVRFDQIPESTSAGDGIHPNTVGHTKMTKILASYMRATFRVTPTPTPTITP